MDSRRSYIIFNWISVVIISFGFYTGRRTADRRTNDHRYKYTNEMFSDKVMCIFDQHQSSHTQQHYSAIQLVNQPDGRTRRPTDRHLPHTNNFARQLNFRFLQLQTPPIYKTVVVVKKQQIFFLQNFISSGQTRWKQNIIIFFKYFTVFVVVVVANFNLNATRDRCKQVRD